MSLNTFTFGGIASSLYNVYGQGAGMFNKPKRRVESIAIPGKSGDLVIEQNAWENVDITYSCILPQAWQSDFDAFVAALHAKKGYQTLTESMHPGYFRMAVFSEAISPKITRQYTGGSFKLKFNAQPQMYLNSGQVATTLTETGTITNPTLYPSKPLLKVYGAGNLGIGGMTITIASPGYSYVYIDCEAMDAYNGATPLNNKITLSSNDFPVFAPGTNNISLGSGITRVEITPRWWTI